MPVLRHDRCSLCRSKTPRADCIRCGARQLSLFDGPPLPVFDDPEAKTIEEMREAGRKRRAEHAARLERLSALGRTIRVGLVGCAKTKRDKPSLCRELYRSPLFLASLAHAERACDETFVVSAAHGLLPLDETVDPYERTLRDLPKKERLAWGERVVESVRCRFERLPLEVLVLAGLEYAEPIQRAVIFRGWTYVAPLARMPIGQRLAWLKAQEPPTALKQRLRGRA